MMYQVKLCLPIGVIDTMDHLMSHIDKIGLMSSIYDCTALWCVCLKMSMYYFSKEWIMAVIYMELHVC